MAYKLIKEWKGIKSRNEHEITVYKYNISHDEMIRYYRWDNKLTITTYLPNELRKEIYEVA